MAALGMTYYAIQNEFGHFVHQIEGGYEICIQPELWIAPSACGDFLESITPRFRRASSPCKVVTIHLRVGKDNIDFDASTPKKDNRT